MSRGLEKSIGGILPPRQEEEGQHSLSSRHKDQVEDVPLGADVDEDLLSSL